MRRVGPAADENAGGDAEQDESEGNEAANEPCAIGEGCAGAREYNDEIRARRRRETNRRKEHEGEETTVTDRSAGAKAIGKLWRRRNEAN